MSTTDWKHKLLAYLHDSPSKALDIARHGEQAAAAMKRAGFSEEEVRSYNRPADHTAAAADRFPFPNSRTSQLRCDFDGVLNAFRHPMGAGSHDVPLTLALEKNLSAVEGIEGEGLVQPGWEDYSSFTPDGEQWRARFFAHWRLWPLRAEQTDSRFATLPADTRLPDHSIWTHTQMVSALATCATGNEQAAPIAPAFLKFQIGPVQDFIAAARSTRDLWSGSYLLSWLMAHGLKQLSSEVGPDSVVFPNLHGQPIFDLVWRDEIWSRIRISKKDHAPADLDTVWDAILNPAYSQADILTPNLPNVFFAVVPANRAAQLAADVSRAIQAEWKTIAESCWKACDSAGLWTEETLPLSYEERRARFDRQIDQFLSVSWQVTPWPETLAEARTLASTLPISGRDPKHPDLASLTERFDTVVTAATETMPEAHRDGRYYVGGNQGPKEVLNNIGLAWSLLYALNSWQLDGVRQVRDFHARGEGGWHAGIANNKDSLTGRDEAIAGGAEWRDKLENHALKRFFKHDDWLGAVSLVKRLWHQTYLQNAKWQLAPQRMPNTQGLAMGDPFAQRSGNEAEDDEGKEDSENYFAVLAFDGDEIGRWVSGEKCPTYGTQLAPGARKYFEANPAFKAFLQTPRLVSPAYHLQLSQALTNFALKCARPIVEAYHGRLIYAGGDDVLALLPASEAVACAADLAAAFSGSAPRKSVRLDERGQLRESEILSEKAKGFLVVNDCRKTDRKSAPFMVPGPAASASVGIAIAHFKSPLQDVVREAKIAEKRAKNQLGRAAVAVTLMKRSGETIQWGTGWEHGGVGLLERLLEAFRTEELSSKFPYRVTELLSPYLTESTGISLGSVKEVPGFESSVDEIIRLEWASTLERQRGRTFDEETRSTLIEQLDAYLEAMTKSHKPPLTAQARLRAMIGLCHTAAFSKRITEENSL